MDLDAYLTVPGQPLRLVGPHALKPAADDTYCGVRPRGNESMAARLRDISCETCRKAVDREQNRR